MKFFVLVFCFCLIFITQCKYYENENYEEDGEDMKLAGEVASFGLDFVPVIGQAKAAYEVVLGKDPVTGKQLSPLDRTLSLVGLIPGGSWFKKPKQAHALKNTNTFKRAFYAGRRVAKRKLFKAAREGIKATQKIKHIKKAKDIITEDRKKKDKKDQKTEN